MGPCFIYRVNISGNIYLELLFSLEQAFSSRVLSSPFSLPFYWASLEFLFSASSLEEAPKMGENIRITLHGNDESMPNRASN